jgi:hypothetical protein
MFDNILRRIDVFAAKQNYKGLVENSLNGYLKDDIGSWFIRKVKGTDWWCNRVSYLLTRAEEYIVRIEGMGDSVEDYNSCEGVFA